MTVANHFGSIKMASLDWHAERAASVQPVPTVDMMATTARRAPPMIVVQGVGARKLVCGHDWCPRMGPLASQLAGCGARDSATPRTHSQTVAALGAWRMATAGVARGSAAALRATTKACTSRLGGNTNVMHHTQRHHVCAHARGHKYTPHMRCGQVARC